MNRVCVLGGSGFIGRHIVHLLSARRYIVTVPTRQRERAKHLIMLPTVDVVEADVHDEAQLERLVGSNSAVINLVGVLHDGRASLGFQPAHVGLARKVIAACGRTGVRRLLHMSALNADANGPSKYLRSKGEAEALVRSSNLDWTVFRPSVVYGPGDCFLNLFANLLEWFPIVPLGSPRARFQPVYVEDVATAFVRSLDDRSTFGQAYDLCGPRVYTLRELVELVGRIVGRERAILGLNDTLSRLQALVMEWMPGKLLTRDNYHSMKAPSVSEQRFPFGIRPAMIEAVVPAYLGNDNPRARYRFYRDRARRATAR